MENKTERQVVCTETRLLEKSFPTLTRCWLRVSLCANSLRDDEGHGVMLLLALRRLRRYLVAYLR